MRRTVIEVEAAGAAAVQIEDQVRQNDAAISRTSSRRRREAIERVAWPSSRAVDDTIVIARTDAVAVAGLEPAIERARPVPTRPVPT